MTLINDSQYLHLKIEALKERGILNDIQIIELGQKGMITPFVSESINVNEHGEKILSYGVSSFGYDIRLAPTVKVFANPDIILDPKNFDESIFYELEINKDDTGEYVILPPHSFALGHTIETFDIPDNIMCLCTCKSTLARISLNLNSTTFEPTFFGQITLELTNPSDNFMKVYVNEGCGQVLFFKGEKPSITYADRKGKYQNQSGITGAKV